MAKATFHLVIGVAKCLMMFSWNILLRKVYAFSLLAVFICQSAELPLSSDHENEDATLQQRTPEQTNFHPDSFGYLTQPSHRAAHTTYGQYLEFTDLLHEEDQKKKSKKKQKKVLTKEEKDQRKEQNRSRQSQPLSHHGKKSLRHKEKIFNRR